jgi:hypothetical protein
MSTQKRRTFDFEIDYEQFQLLADQGRAILDALGVVEDGKPEPQVRPLMLYWMNTTEWCQVCDVFGKMIRGVDWPMEVGCEYELAPINMPYHETPQPLRVYVVRQATHAEAIAIAGHPLAPRRYYYEVHTD